MTDILATDFNLEQAQDNFNKIFSGLTKKVMQAKSQGFQIKEDLDKNCNNPITIEEVLIL